MAQSFLLAALALGFASASAQSVNTQVNGITLTTGLGSITDASTLNATNRSTGISYLTDNDTSTFVLNMTTGSLQGNFSGTIPSSSTGIYIVGAAGVTNGSPQVLSGPSFSVQLLLLGGLSSARTYGDANYVVTQQVIPTISYFVAFDGSGAQNFDPVAGWSQALYYAYLDIPFTDFGTTYDQVVGIKLGNFTFRWPDISYIGAGYSGASSPGPIPEPSTYGLALGGLALVGAVIRRRRSK